VGRAVAFLKSCGYEGVEWTVRPGGFIDPVSAKAADFKRTKAAADAAGGTVNR